MHADTPRQATAVVPWSVVLHGTTGRITLGLVVTEISVAVQVLLLDAALPAVARDLGQLNLYGWALAGGALGLVLATPIAGRAADRVPGVRLLEVSALLTVAGIVISALAPSMSVVVAGRVLVGCGTATQYALSLAAALRQLAPEVRPRVFAVIGLAWVIPGLAGPALGGVLAATVGWRWALAAPLPLVIVSRLLVLPSVRASPVTRRGGGDSVVGPAIVTTLGIAAILAALSDPGLRMVAVAGVGAVALVVGVRGQLPRILSGSGPGFASVLGVMVLLNLAYFGGDGFLPLALNGVLGRSLPEASLSLTISSVMWAVGGAGQASLSGRLAPRVLIAGGAILIFIGALGAILALESGIVLIAYAFWTMSGLGMGVAYQTAWLLGGALSSAGEEGGSVGAILLAETAGASLGAGLAGAAVAMVGTGAVSLRNGLVLAFVVVAAGAAVTALLGGLRIHSS